MRRLPRFHTLCFTLAVAWMTHGAAAAQPRYMTPALNDAVAGPGFVEQSFSIGSMIGKRMLDWYGLDEFKNHPHMLPSVCVQEQTVLRLLQKFQSDALRSTESELSSTRDALWAEMHQRRHRLTGAVRHAAAFGRDTDTEPIQELRGDFLKATQAFETSPKGRDHLLIRMLELALRDAQKIHVDRCHAHVLAAKPEDLQSADKSLAGIQSTDDFIAGWLAQLEDSRRFRLYLKELHDIDAQLPNTRERP